jgi:hypothetical protein
MAVNDIVMGAAGASSPATYIEDVFSTYLYTGNSSTQTITNGIDLAGKGGLVWAKLRSGANDHFLFDTQRGVEKELNSNTTEASTTAANSLTSFNSNGFTAGTSPAINNNSATYASWTFRKQPKFFDIVTWTGNSVDPRLISHNLGSVPGCIFVKRTDTAANWVVYHRSTGANNYLILNSTAAVNVGDLFNATPTTTNFSVSSNAAVNVSGGTYVAYLFAHDAGGFGLTGTDNVISCGSYTGDNTSNRAITLGYEPQWILWKSSSYPSGQTDTNWQIYDTMRGWLGNATATGADSLYLVPSTPSPEAGENAIAITPTGFTVGKTTGGLTNKSGDTYIYIAIRRPMKTPTTGTSVFDVEVTSTDAVTMTTGFPVDFYVVKRTTALDSWFTTPRLTTQTSKFDNTGAENNYASYFNFDSNTTIGVDSGLFSTNTRLNYAFQRAPNFFDVVCYTGTGVARTVNHNLTVAPELMIVKRRNVADSWWVYNATIGNTKVMLLDMTIAATASNAAWNNTSPTSTNFTVNTESGVNASGGTYVAYLFATCAGVSKVGSYTGTGATQTINAGLASGARFVMIKRTDSTGDWFVWDTARGMVAGTDPRLALNLISAETNANWVYTVSTGFQIVTTDASVNASGGSYIYLAIA